MTMQNMAIMLYLSLMCLVLFAAADDSQNTTKPWSVQDSDRNEEDILHSERSREFSVSNLRHQKESATQPTYESDKTNMDKLPFQEPSDLHFLSKSNNAEIERHINSTFPLEESPVEEGILFSERDRDESLSAIIFRPDEEKSVPLSVNVSNSPKFEFLIGMPMDNFTGPGNGGNGAPSTTHKPFIPPKSAWPVPQAQLLTTEPRLNHTTGLPLAEQDPKLQDNGPRPPPVEDYVELVEISKNDPSSNKSVPVFSSPHANGTGFFLENDAIDSSFTDIQTLFLACFATLVPLLIALFLACGLRMAWKRCIRERRSAGYQGGLRGASADPLPEKRSRSPSTQIRSVESGFTQDGVGDGGDEGCGVRNMDNLTTQPPANGSIITMTLKNNHLIVETEVRNDIAHGSRETKMKYSPNNDGVFVVEVQQSNSEQSRYKPSECAQVHRSPVQANTSVDTDEEADYRHSLLQSDSKTTNGDISMKNFGSTNTGLSTSDLSLSSSGSHNPSYAYGNQTGYEQGRYGYPQYAGYVPPPVASIPCESSREPLITKTPTDPDKPVVTAAIFKQDSLIAGEDAFKAGYNIEGSTDGPLLSDIQAREISLHKLQDKIEHGSKIRMIANSDSMPPSDSEDDKHQEQQHQLGNGMLRKQQTIVEINHEKSNQSLNRADSLPPRLIEQMELCSNGKATKNGCIVEDSFDTIEEEAPLECYPGDIASGSPLLGTTSTTSKSKRGSLPLITPDLYSSIKQSTKNILPNTSPKFEKLNNENSPMDSISEKQSTAPPLITVTEEVEPSGSGDGQG